MPKYGHKQAKKSPTWQWNLRKFQIPAKSLDFNLKIYQKKFSAFSPQLGQKEDIVYLDFHNFQLLLTSSAERGRAFCARAMRARNSDPSSNFRLQNNSNI